MKILLVNCVYGKGSTGSIVKSLFEELNKNNDVEVIYGRGKVVKSDFIKKETLEFESNIHHFFSLFNGNMYGGMSFSTHKIIKEIKRFKPDVINLHCLNGYFVNIYKLLKWLAKNNFKTVLTMHADFMMTGGCGIAMDCKKYLSDKCNKCPNIKRFNGRFSFNRTHHFYKKLDKSLQYFNKENLKISCVSPWLQQRYKESPLYNRFIVESILNPVDPFFYSIPGENPYKSRKNVLYITPDINDIVKGGWQIKDIAKLRKDINFTVICINDVPFEFDNENITYIKGGVSKDKLLDYYFYADATLILSKRETFSMVVAESLSCGTPVYGFKCGGPETIAINPYSFFCEYGDIKTISEILCKKSFDKKLIQETAFNKYSSSKIAGLYLDLYCR